MFAEARLQLQSYLLELVSQASFGVPERVRAVAGHGRCDDGAASFWSGAEKILERLVFELLYPFVSSRRGGNYLSSRKRGRKRGIEELRRKLPGFRYVLKTDVHSYYASIDLFKLFNILFSELKVPSWLLRLVVLTTIPGTNNAGVVSAYRPHGQTGLRKGSALSVLLAEVYLQELDNLYTGRGDIYYQRYVDDIIILAASRRSLRRAIRDLKQLLQERGLKTRYGKTYIGRTTDTILYLGYRLRTVANGEVRIEGRSRESKKRSVKRRAERLLEAGEAMAELGVDPKPPDVSSRGQTGTKSGALLCYAHGSTCWYAVLPESAKKLTKGSHFRLADANSNPNSEYVEETLREAEKHCPNGIRYWKIVCSGRQLRPKKVGFVVRAREKLSPELINFMQKSFGKRSSKWCQNGV